MGKNYTEGSSGNPGYDSAINAVVSFIELHGTADTTIPYVGGLKMDARANATGVPHDLITIPGAEHMPFGNILDPNEPYFLRWLNDLSGFLNLAKAECPSAPMIAV